MGTKIRTADLRKDVFKATQYAYSIYVCRNSTQNESHSVILESMKGRIGLLNPHRKCDEKNLRINFVVGQTNSDK